MASLLSSSSGCRAAVLLVACLLLASGSCSEARRQLKQAPETPWQHISSTPGLEILASLVRAANLTDALDQPNLNYTLLLPNNASFANLEVNQGITVDQLMNSSALQSVLLYHVFPNGGLTPGNLTSGEALTMANNDTVTIVDASYVGIPLAFRDLLGRMIPPIGTPKTLGDNVVYIVSSVLLPIAPTTIGQALSYETDLSTMSDLLTYLTVQEMSMNETDKFFTNFTYGNMTNVTFLVPSNDAFTSLCVNMSMLLNDTDYLRETIKAHIIPVSLDFNTLVALDNSTIPTMLNNASFKIEYLYGTIVLFGNGTVPSTLIITPDLVAGASRIHVINTVLFPQIPGKPEFSCPRAPPGDYSVGDYQSGTPSAYPPVYGSPPTYGGSA